MNGIPAEFEQFHWMVDMVQNVDLGLIVVDKEFNVHLWNGFMTHHSGKQAHDVMGKSLFEIFPEIDSSWFKAKSKPVFELGTRSFVIWRQRPYLFHCRNVRPITQQSHFMYQNVTLNPMRSTTGEIKSMFLAVEDVTAEALAETLNK
ncbi:PAS domain S-box protein [Aliivibrio sp. S4TY2]|jgi:PAS domain S-box-containing protein|uniref:PAS domain S-box protein n=1 Tax=Aliivibrio finisterrensis TaxID=511998 RepID=A0A4Q5KSZ7_9GAMM|nr:MULTISPECIES: PAS domain S-box protein [Aliivibrio]KAB2824535.1 PAS domain S-box protein [Aliivibrio finisterrensis]MDD9157860.1 PAS domain S-box protein [Aliivibrio sp. S4TY2]MDD9161788.1 PAS domain S-box protein [Aliivibrio sp. S4TY1]MDD9165818.1 PAS domain S-box protein [Aliivibrio sp. S4MY2]MDD9169859.1 PAS domain S-box protein [Aliivibrio sp. S4MY4]